MDLNKLFLITMSTLFVNNLVFSRFLGLCPFFGVSKKMSSAIGMGFAVLFVLVMSMAVIYPVNLLLLSLGLEFLQVIVFILVIASGVQLVEIFLKKMAPALYHALGIYLPLITTNCAILGTAFLVLKEQYNFLESLVFALMAGLGFTLALIMMASVRERLELAKVPKAFKGLPIAFISAALMSMAMYAFVGFVK